MGFFGRVKRAKVFFFFFGLKKKFLLVLFGFSVGFNSRVL